MAKRMTDEQKLFFGTKSQRRAVMKKHPSWAKDKSGFRQTVKGYRNPFKKVSRVVKKIAKKVKKPVKPGTKKNGGSSAWMNAGQTVETARQAAGDVLFNKKNLELIGGLVAAPAVPGLGGLLGGSISGGKATKAGQVVDVWTAGMPTVRTNTYQETTLEDVERSNLAWMEAHPGGDPYGIYDPQYFLG